jgi:hypothetical protein
LEKGDTDMGQTGSSFVEHVAILVKDIDWYIDFFTDILGMSIVKTSEESGVIKNVWLNGGIQLTLSENFYENSCIEHLGIVVRNLDATLMKIYSCKNIIQVPDKSRNWVELPEGLQLEIFQEKDSSVEKVLSIIKR